MIEREERVCVRREKGGIVCDRGWEGKSDGKKEGRGGEREDPSKCKGPWRSRWE